MQGAFPDGSISYTWKKEFLYILLKEEEEKRGGGGGRGEERKCGRVGREMKKVEAPPLALQNPSRLPCKFLE